MSEFPTGPNMLPGKFIPQTSGFATRAIHEGNEPEQWSSNSLIPPISMSTTFKQDAPTIHKGFEYGRSGNPTRQVLEKCLASMDNAKHALTFSSGLGATTALLHLLSAGDHLIASDDLYGGTYRYFSKVLQRMNITVTYVNGVDTEGFVDAIRENTKLVWVESPTNPLLKVVDIQKICDAIHRKNKNILVIVDNTFLSAYFQKPLTLGADIVMYSLTKYMNGHGDVIMGSAATNNVDVYEKLKFLQNALGIVPSPFDCYLVNRSLKTLHLRMKEHMANSIAVGEFLENHPLVEKLLHPGLPSHPQYSITLRQCSGYSGMVSFYMKGGPKEVNTFLKALKVVSLAESLGGYETLVEVPSLMTHASIPLEERMKFGITDNLIRLSVGLENAEDIIKDLDQALKAAMQ